MKRVGALLALSVFIAQVAQASPVRSIFASQAEGKSGQLTTVVLWPGYGTNLNLIPTGEVVKKAWLDDPSRVAIDFDGCLGQSAGAGNGGGEGCGATVIHLRQITGVNFPGLMTSSNASTLLTLIADGSQGKKLYQFKVVMGQGTPQYSTITIQPDSQGTPYIDVGLRRAPLEDVEKGLAIAESKKLINRRDSAWSKVQNFLAQVRNGESINTAAQVTGANMAIITKLAELGGTIQPIAPVAPLPVLPPSIKMEEAKPAVVVPPAIDKPKTIPPVIKVEEPKPTPAMLPVKPPEIVAKAPEVVLVKETSKPVSVSNKSDVGYWLLDQGMANTDAWSKGPDGLDYQVFFDFLQRGKETGASFSESLATAQRLSRVDDKKLASLTRMLAGKRLAQKQSPNAAASTPISKASAIIAPPVIASEPLGSVKTEKAEVVAPKLAPAPVKPQPAKLNPIAPQPVSLPPVHVTSMAVALPKTPELKPVDGALPGSATAVNPDTPKVIAESPSQILAHYQIPLKEGGSITADKLLDVQQRIWNWKKGIYRQKLGKFIATLITAQDADKDHAIQEAVQQSGLSLNDVRYLAKASQTSVAAAPASSVEMKTEPLAPPQVPSPLLNVVRPTPVPALVSVSEAPGAKPTSTVASLPVSTVKSVLPTGGTTDTLFKLRIPLKDGGSVGAEQLLTVQERIWNWKGGSVRKQLGRFIAVLAASAAQGNEQAIVLAVQESGLSLNEVQYLLSKTTAQTISSKE